MASAAARTSTTKRFRTDASISFSITCHPGWSVLLKARDDVVPAVGFELALDGIAGLQPGKDLLVLDFELHRHPPHQAGDVLVVEGDRPLLRIYDDDLPLDVVDLPVLPGGAAALA